jgi:superfamily I DNA and/or RNA helicase
LAVKEWVEKDVVKSVRVVVCTCKAAKGKLLRRQHFPRVIIDEATQAHEIETLETIIDAKQVVLVGDQQQLGPVFRGSTPYLDSMLSRLVEADFPNFVMLDE